MSSEIELAYQTNVLYEKEVQDYLAKLMGNEAVQQQGIH